jgi:hypothetical protein
MPAAMERKLKKQAAKHKGWSKERKDAYVYGTLRKTGWVPTTQRKHRKKAKKGR